MQNFNFKLQFQVSISSFYTPYTVTDYTIFIRFRLKTVWYLAGPDLGAGQAGTCPGHPQIVDLGQPTDFMTYFFVLMGTSRNWSCLQMKFMMG